MIKVKPLQKHCTEKLPTKQVYHINNTLTFYLVCLFQGWDGYRGLPWFPLCLTNMSVFAEDPQIREFPLHCKGLFDNYVDMMRRVGGSKMSIFFHIQGKTCPCRGRQVVKKGLNHVHVVIE